MEAINVTSRKNRKYARLSMATSVICLRLPNVLLDAIEKARHQTSPPTERRQYIVDAITKHLPEDLKPNPEAALAKLKDLGRRLTQIREDQDPITQTVELRKAIEEAVAIL